MLNIFASIRVSFKLLTKLSVKSTMELVKAIKQLRFLNISNDANINSQIFLFLSIN